MSTRKSKTPREILEDAIAEVNLIDEALSGLSDNTGTYVSLAGLINDLRQEHEGLLHALEVHATQKDRLSKGMLGSLIGVLGTIPSWVKIKSDLRSIKFMLGNLEKRASGHQELMEAISQLKQATQPTRASLNVYNDVRASEEHAVTANRPPRDDLAISTITHSMTATRFGRGLDNQMPERMSNIQAPSGYTSNSYFLRQSSQHGTASDPQTGTPAQIQPSRSASEGFHPSIPPQAPNLSGSATNAQLGQGYTASAQGLQSHDGRVPLGRDYYRRLFPSVLASQSILPAQYFEEAGPTHGQPHRKSNEIPPPEPDAPYTPPNALSPPPRQFYAYGDPSVAQSPSFPGFFPSQVTGPSSGPTHTRGLSDLSAFNNANRSASSVGSREYASSQSTSGASDQPQDVRTRASFSGDSWDGSRQYTNHASSYQRDNGSFDAESGISSRSKSSGSYRSDQ